MAKKIFMFRIFILSLFLLIFSTKAFSQFVLDLDIREKPYLKIEDKTKLHNTQRLTLFAKYKDKKGIWGWEVGFQDTRAYSNYDYKANTGFGISSLHLYVNFLKHYSIDFGRIPLAYDDFRLMVTTPGWGDYTRGVDALMLKYNNKEDKTKVDLGFSLSNFSPFNQNYYKALAWMHADQSMANDKLRMVAMYFARMIEAQNEVASSSTAFQHYIGLYIYLFEKEKVNAMLNGYVQIGKNSDLSKQFGRVMTVQLNYKPIDKFKLNLSYDFTDGGFDKFLGSGHNFFGYLDYIILNGKKGLDQGKGLHHPYIRLYFDPVKNHSFELSGRYFLLKDPNVVDKSLKEGDEFYGIPREMSRNLGGEIDFMYSYDIRKDLKIMFAYGLYIPSETFVNLRGYKYDKSTRESGLLHQFFMTLWFRPVIFNSDNCKKKKDAQGV